jgi:hypothetical protein
MKDLFLTLAYQDTMSAFRDIIFENIKDPEIIEKYLRYERLLHLLLELNEMTDEMHNEMKMDWKLLHDKGKLCLHDYFRFNLVEYREEGIKQFMQCGLEKENKKIINKLKKKYKIK